MSKDLLKVVINQGVRDNLNTFFLGVSNDYSEIEDDLSIYDDDRFTNFQTIGEIVFNPNEKLVVVTTEVSEDLTERSGKKNQYEKAKKILKDYMKYDAGIFVFSDPAGSFRFSLVYGQADGTRKSWSNFRRFTYFVSRDQTNKTFCDRIGRCDFSSLDIIKDAFSVEKVNKEFYQQIARYYYRLTGKNDYEKEMALPSVSEGDERKYEEFAVRLIGRIIFCWFLRHKKSSGGIPLIPREVLSLGAAESHTDYYHSILEPLFFEVMNRPVKERKPVAVPQSALIPFLNGGLFEPHRNDYYEKAANYALKIPDGWFADFFSVLEQYNFTIDENSIVDADVSVDPEMLGRIFENLLAEVVPETGETARKATGSYYTPRAIVDYMVEQSLKQYLITKTSLPEGKLDSLLSYEDEDVDLSDGERNVVVTALKEIKVIDPACGSGAFPMGILHRMLLVLEKADPRLEIWRRQYLDALDPIVRQVVMKNIRRENWVYIRKLMIIRDSIYGVDIQPVAVEIAKLRCFLSLVVDEIVLDNEENRGIGPLPNLEFKFVAANTLIGLPPKDEAQGAFGSSKAIEKLKELRGRYLRSYGKEKAEIEKQFRDIQRKLLEETLAWEAKNTALMEVAQKLTEWDPFSYESCGWFDPGWMFGVEDGFYLVIANPPYMDSRAMVGRGQKSFREAIVQSYSMTRGSWDIYIAFFELGFKVMNRNGVLTFITPDKWISKPFGDELRRVKLSNIFSIVRSGREVFESSNIDSIISFFSHAEHGQLHIIDSEYDRFVLKRLVDKAMLKPPYTFDYLFSDYLEFLLKLDSLSGRVSDLADCENSCATDDAYKLKPLITDSLRDIFDPNRQLKVINTGTINKYAYRWGHHEMTYLGRKFLCPVVSRSKFTSLFPKSYGKKSVRPKIIIKGLNLLDACLDSDGTVIPGIPTLVITDNDLDNLKFLLSVLNSKVAFFYVKERYPASSYNLGTNFTPEMINNLPLPQINKQEQKPFINLVENILNVMADAAYFENNKKQLKVKEYQSSIDQMVYELYRLTPEEIAVIEGKANKWK
jgi:hypothetical protein